MYEVLNIRSLKQATPNLRVINLWGVSFVDDSHVEAFSSNCIQLAVLCLNYCPKVQVCNILDTSTPVQYYTTHLGEQSEDLAAALQAPDLLDAAADRPGGGAGQPGGVGQGQLPVRAGHHCHGPEHPRDPGHLDQDPCSHMALCWTAGWDD